VLLDVARRLALLAVLSTQLAPGGNHMNKIPFGLTPEARDIVIRRNAGDPNKYTLGTVQRPVLMICRSRQSAIKLSTEFAAIHGIRVWLFDQGLKPILILDTEAVEAS
jgi:hypothetical protein